ncbi:Cytoplasmic and mitochondrial histidine tRNA synthetase [Cladophialophora chaetospira]|uniref:histidine--tRNA ligase n=1 Tax=Cladophialophora chaetospira TaxID=386627 RepID=A0AA38XM06_9EURO|nr:Cytoplasmic and mitochondrial histidine tRNA synthetase [Cladophialophora chaetospira]
MAKEKKNKNKETLKNPKGTRDWSGDDVVLLKAIRRQIESVFEKYRAQELDTPVFELQEVLKGKYGEDSKLIYDLQDQGGELLSLRYDMTVPFARWLAMNPDIESSKRYAIGKVYRRDQPAISKGRMREFWQCDIDFAGETAPMFNDSEIISCVVKIFEALEWTGYTIKLNDRRILDGLFEVCGVPEEKLRTISSAVDKLDKLPWEEVKKEMVEQKGLEEAVADKIQTYVTRKGGKELLEELKKDEALMSNTKAKTGIEEMGLLMRYLQRWKALDKISFDLSLARGLDYYTGVIYEVVTEGSAGVSTPAATKIKESAPPMPPAASTESESTPVPSNGASNGIPRREREKKKVSEDEDRSDDPTVGVGSVAAGGRYDNLVERFRPGANLPCVGVSFGIDRIIAITKARIAKGERFSYIKPNRTDAYIMAFGGSGFSGMFEERIDVLAALREAGFRAETFSRQKAKLQKQFQLADRAAAPVAVILGEDEQARGEVKVKQMGLPDGHPEKDGVLVKVDELVDKVRSVLDQLDK